MATILEHFRVETDAYTLRKYGPTHVDDLLADLRRQISSAPFTAPGVVALRIVAELERDVPAPVAVAAVEPDPAPEAEPKPARAKKKAA